MTSWAQAPLKFVSYVVVEDIPCRWGHGLEGEGREERSGAAPPASWHPDLGLEFVHPFSDVFECQWNGCHFLYIHGTNLTRLTFLMWLWPRLLWNKSWGLCWTLLREMDHNFLAVGFTGNTENSLHGPLNLLWSFKVRKTWSPEGRSGFGDWLWQGVEGKGCKVSIL